MGIGTGFNTALGKLVRLRLAALAALIAASALLAAAPAAAETSESSSGSGWTVQEEGESGSGGEADQGSSIGSGAPSATPAPPPEEPAPAPEETYEEPSYSGEESSYAGESGGEYESEAGAPAYAEPVASHPRPHPAPKPLGGSVSTVRPEPSAEIVDVSASPAPQGTPFGGGTSVVSGAKVLLWLAALAVGIVLVADPRLRGRRSPPSRAPRNGRPPGPIGPTVLEGSRHRSPSSPRPRRFSSDP